MNRVFKGMEDENPEAEFETIQYEKTFTVIRCVFQAENFCLFRETFLSITFQAEISPFHCIFQSSLVFCLVMYPAEIPYMELLAKQFPFLPSFSLVKPSFHRKNRNLPFWNKLLEKVKISAKTC